MNRGHTAGLHSWKFSYDGVTHYDVLLINYCTSCLLHGKVGHTQCLEKVAVELLNLLTQVLS